MLKNILKLKGTQQLSKKEQNTIHGGAGPCSVYDSVLGEWIMGWSVDDAQDAYNNDPVYTGYCCASCGGIP